MIFKKSFKFRLCPNQSQANLCLQFAGASRWIYSGGLDQRDKLWKEQKRSISLYMQNHARVKNQKKDFQHKLSTELVKSHDKIVIENLAVKELLEKVPTDRARAISDAGWPGFLHMLQYKCEEYGKKLVEASRYFPSTKQCYNYKKIHDIPLNQRIYSCNCGHQMHRHNAA